MQACRLGRRRLTLNHRNTSGSLDLIIFHITISAISIEWQDWYGPSGRYVKNYDISEIKSSLAYTALRGKNFSSFRNGWVENSFQKSANLGKSFWCREAMLSNVFVPPKNIPEFPGRK